MITASQLAEAFARNLWVIQAQTEGLTHETYHVGQAELLRQLAGKDDKVI